MCGQCLVTEQTSKKHASLATYSPPRGIASGGKGQAMVEVKVKVKEKRGSANFLREGGVWSIQRSGKPVIEQVITGTTAVV